MHVNIETRSMLALDILRCVAMKNTTEPIEITIDRIQTEPRSDLDSPPLARAILLVRSIDQRDDMPDICDLLFIVSGESAYIRTSARAHYFTHMRIVPFFMNFISEVYPCFARIATVWR